MNRTLERIVKSMPATARQAVLEDPQLQGQLIRIYQQHPDGHGYHGEIRCLPTMESHRRKMRRKASGEGSVSPSAQNGRSHLVIRKRALLVWLTRFESKYHPTPSTFSPEDSYVFR